MTYGISPGLLKTTLLLKGVELPWKAIHVAGTNGKGSTCTYIAAMLRAANIRIGRFVSPHLRYRWDGITINERTVPRSLFMQVEAEVKERNARHNIGASNFELLTVSAFEIFKQQEVDVGIVECGMGGRLDATNVLKEPLVSVITNIDFDHQDFLGSTMAEIASHKAGIIKSGTPCVLSSQNTAEATDIVSHEAAEKNVKLEIARDIDHEMPGLASMHDTSSLSPTQRQNMGCALRAVNLALARLATDTKVDLGHLTQLLSSERFHALAPAMLQSRVPGRYQELNFEQLTGRRASVLVDGAHNTKGWQLLRDHVNRSLRGSGSGSPVTWLMAQSQSKHKTFETMIDMLCQTGDKVVLCEFKPVDGMPWVRPADPKTVVDVPGSGVVISGTCTKHELRQAVDTAVGISREGPMVITGSLYLVFDILQLLDKPDQVL